MPDTFAHLGVQALASRGLFKDADIKWIAVGCIIPDVPWIVQRVFLALHVPVDPFTLRFYAIVQASLFCCLLLAGAIALLAGNGRRIFLLLALNSFLHLFLDALQIKWANGVHFFAPFCWQLTGFGLFWPDHPVSTRPHPARGPGPGVLRRQGLGTNRLCSPRPRRRHTAAVLLLAAYLALPPFFSYGPRQEDNHFAATLLAVQERPGRYVELDRAAFHHRDNTILLLNGERIRLEGRTPPADGLISIKGRFSDTGTIHVSDLHVHTTLRDLSSKVALAGIMLLWLIAFVRKRITFQ